jgi:hypothetical protein
VLSVEGVQLGHQAHSRNLILTDGTFGDDFTVPTGKAFVLTDIIISPQIEGASGPLLVQVTASDPFTTALSLTSSGENPASFQVHLTAGMVFLSGSTIRASVRQCSNQHERLRISHYRAQSR